MSVFPTPGHLVSWAGVAPGPTSRPGSEIVSLQTWQHLPERLPRDRSDRYHPQQGLLPQRTLQASRVTTRPPSSAGRGPAQPARRDLARPDPKTALHPVHKHLCSYPRSPPLHTSHHPNRHRAPPQHAAPPRPCSSNTAPSPRSRAAKRPTRPAARSACSQQPSRPSFHSIQPIPEQEQAESTQAPRPPALTTGRSPPQPVAQSRLNSRLTPA